MDDLLAQLDDCGLGAMVGSPSPMYADDLSLIADSHDNLQSLLDIVTRYASVSLRSWSSGNLLDPALLVVNLVLSMCAQSLYKNVTATPTWALTPSIGLWLYQDLKPWLRRQERFLRPEFSRYTPSLLTNCILLYASQLCSMGQNFGPSLKLTSPC